MAASLMLLATAVLAATGLGLAAFAPLAVIAPDSARQILRGFAQSALLHYAEIAARLAVGASLVVLAPRMPFERLFHVFGWLIIATTAGLLLLPWRWHRRFADRVIPVVIRFLPLYALASFMLGIFILHGVATASF